VKLRVIAPIVLSGTTPDSVEEYLRAAPPGCQVEVTFLDRGPASIESEYEESLAVPDIVAKTRAAAADGADAVIISCMLDPGVKAAREHVSIPVLGPAQVSMHLAATLGPTFSIVTVLDRLIPPLLERARLYGLSDHLASVRAVEIPVLELWSNREQVVEALVTQAAQAVSKDGAYVIILGCTGMAGMARAIGKALRRQGYDVPVIDPTVTTIKVAAALVGAGLSHSKRAYPTPPEKPVFGYPP
jgi:allantoin racemase